MTLTLIHNREPVGMLDWKRPSVFLAGPTPRDANTKSWRPEAIRLFGEYDFDGVLYVPENRTGICEILDYSDQIDWEQEYLNKATVIMMWMPRDKDNLPGFTSNIEFGMFYKQKNFMYGRPDNAYKTAYLDYVYYIEHDGQKNEANSLEKLVQDVLYYIKGKVI